MSVDVGGAPGRIRAWVGVGANLGDARATVERALSSLAQLPQTTLAARSSLYRSAPVESDGPDFVNAVAALDTGLAPHALLAQLQMIEAKAGRLRPYRGAPRTLDLDLLAWDAVELDDPALTLPHPRLHLRAFVLEPLAELAPALSLPRIGPLARWRRRVADQVVTRIE